MTKLKTCPVCIGTGRLVLRRSWFTADGFRSERCGICQGSGECSARGSHIDEYAAEQRRMRELKAAA